MRWFKPNLRGSIHAIFSSTRPPASAESMPHVGIEDIRGSMLALIADVGEHHFPQVTRRIRYALDVQALWYLRGDLMAVLASRDGEAAALRQLEPITQMFEDMLPRGLKSRHSPLSSMPRS